MLMFGILILTSLVSAVTSDAIQDPKFIGKTLEGITIYDTCTFDGFACDSSYSCTFTIIAPDKTILISKNLTTHSGDVYSYTLNSTQTSQNGLHEVISYCTNVTYSGKESFYYEINPAGVRNSMIRTVTISIGIVFMFIIAILLFMAFITYSGKSPMKLTYMILSFTFFLISLNLITVSLADVIINPRLTSFFDSFTAISFILYWFLGGLLILLWMYTTYNTLIYKKMLSDAHKYGEGEGGFGI